MFPGRLTLLAQLAVVATLQLHAAATVTLDKATVTGTTNGSVTSYWGIPYAESPVGDLRLRLPKAISSYRGEINASVPGVQCVQYAPTPRADLPLDLYDEMLAYVASITVTDYTPPQSEDCLTINVQVPKGTNAGDKLPVIAAIYGGGFVSGNSYQMAADVLIQRSIELKQPVIVAAMNYRLGAFGQLGGKEVKEAGVGNLALQDQRTALRWINKHIAAFGGDPNRVTLWGVSAGAISISLQMLTNGGNTEGLFHGAIMHSGSPIPTGDITLLQPYYDQLVEEAGCASAKDTLECIRQLPLDTLVAATATLPNLFDYAGLTAGWSPTADGTFLKKPPQQLVLEGSVADIPFLSGDVLDEGTVFALSSFNVSTDAEFEDYVNTYYYTRAPRSALKPLFTLYPDDPAQGSPFGTGDEYQLYPLYKRMAAFQGDYVFQAPRRFFLDERASKQPTWSFINARGRVEDLGYPHGADIAQAIQGNDFTDYIIQFAATQNPNDGTSKQTISWPKYDTASRKVLEIVEDGLVISKDTNRTKAMDELITLSLAYPL